MDFPGALRDHPQVRRVLLWLAGVVGVLVLLAVGALLWLHIPGNASAMAAKSVCSAAFVAGRSTDRDLMAEDVLPASPVLTVVSTDVDEQQHTVTARFLGLFPRTAALVSGRGCVLDLPADPAARTYQPTARAGQWPDGDTPVAPDQWPAEVDEAALAAAVDTAFEGAGDPAAANARAVAVVQDGRLLVLREAPGFGDATALHGWSMTKTVVGMLYHAIAADRGLTLDTPVVAAFPAEREPAWVAQWRADERAGITLGHLLRMLDGLANTEDYQPWGSVPQMLYGEGDMAGWAADHSSEAEPGARWRYLSGTTNILSDVLRAQFSTDEQYWAYPQRTLFEPLGLTSATLETDTSGTWVGSSYLWASVGDWARLGQLMLADGTWQGQRLLPPGWWRLAGEPALPEGEGRGYGAATWRIGDPQAGGCAATAGIPADALAMEGHWGQVVAMVPSKGAVVARLGWTTSSDQFDECAFLGSILAALPEGSPAR